MDEVELCGVLTRVPRMVKVLEAIWLFAPLNEVVLVQGETGTGKTLIARALHAVSHRASSPFITVECGALPETLMESELFGFERGAFTGADRAYTGRVEAARGGTLFLDEINSISIGTQGKLLRLLEEGEFFRVGRQHPISIEVRLVAASNVPLERMVESGLMRSDFFYRLNVLRVEVPPLRERIDDIPLLVRQFLARDPLPRRFGVTRVDEREMDRLRGYAWPGNVRELFNVLRRSVVVGGEGGTIRHCELPTGQAPGVVPETLGGDGHHPSFRDWMQAREREYLAELVERYDGSARQAAASGLPQRTLHRKIHKLGLGTRRSTVSAVPKPPSGRDPS